MWREGNVSWHPRGAAGLPRCRGVRFRSPLAWTLCKPEPLGGRRLFGSFGMPVATHLLRHRPPPAYLPRRPPRAARVVNRARSEAIHATCSVKSTPHPGSGNSTSALQSHRYTDRPNLVEPPLFPTATRFGGNPGIIRPRRGIRRVRCPAATVRHPGIRNRPARRPAGRSPIIPGYAVPSEPPPAPLPVRRVTG